MTDQEILKHIKDFTGIEDREVTKLYKQYNKEFIGFAKRNFYGIKDQQIEDAYQECFHALYRNIKNGRLVSLSCSLKSYLFQIGKYKIIDEMNRSRRLMGQEIIDYRPPEEISSLDYFDDDEQTRKALIVNKVISSLKEPCKTLLNLFWYEEKSDKEIVATTSYTSTETVKNQRSRCMKMLRIKCN